MKLLIIRHGESEAEIKTNAMLIFSFIPVIPEFMSG